MTNRFQFKFLLFILFLSLPSIIYSQAAPEKSTRQDNLLNEKEEQFKRSLTAPSEEARPQVPLPQVPLPAEKETRFFVKKINLEGVKSFPPSSFDSILKDYEGREVSLNDLYLLSRKIEEEYLRRGVIAAVFLPQQRTAENTITLSVVEAKMGKLKIQEETFFKKKQLERYWKIPEGGVLKYDSISQSLQMMNKNPDRKVKLTLKAGEAPETSDVILTQETNFPVHFFSTYDNDGVVATGRSRVNLGIRDNNLLGLDDILLGGYIFGRDFDGKYIYHNLPLGYNGTSLLYGYSYNRSSPSKEFSALRIRSRSREASLSMHQDLFRKGNYFGEAFFGFLASDRNISTDSGVFSNDKLRIFNLGSSFYWNRPDSATVVSPQVFQGVNGFGSTSKNNPLASRGAKPNFTKGNIDISHRRLIPFNLEANTRLRGQVASTKLPVQEQFTLGGLDTVRGYPAGDYLADNAALLNLEILAPEFFIPEWMRLPYSDKPLKKETSLLAFLDYGLGQVRGRTDTEKKSVSFLGIGVGFRFMFYNQISLETTWGFAVGHEPLTEGGHSQFRIAINFQESIPRELKRIKNK